MSTITQFKEIKGFEGLYEIDNNGNVKSLINDIILKPSITKNGYCHVSLCKDGKKYSKWVHRLVAEAFLPNPHNLPQVNHIREFEKTNNHVELELDSGGNVVVNEKKSNLEWCDAKYNTNYGTRNERVAAKNRGKKQSKETIEKRAEKLRGKKRTEEQRARISEKQRNKRLKSKSVVAVDKDNNVIYEFTSTMEAGRNGFCHSAVAKCCNNCFNREGNNVYKKLRWYWKKDWLEMQQKNAVPHKRETAYQLEINFD